MSVWKQVGQQLGGMAKQVAQTVADVPGEIFESAIGQTPHSGGDNQGMEAVEQGGQTANSQQQAGDDSGAPKGFRTKDDFQKYQNLAGKRDDLELAHLRQKLQAEWGLETNLESGMQRARAEYEQKEEQRKQVEEKKEEQEKAFEFQKKKQEDIALTAAKSEASAENKAWGAG